MVSLVLCGWAVWFACLLVVGWCLGCDCLIMLYLVCVVVGILFVCFGLFVWFFDWVDLFVVWFCGFDNCIGLV